MSSQPEVLGPFRVVRVIGRGGMGAVYEAVHEETHETVALKVLTNSEESNELRARFESEIGTLRRLRHPNIVRLYGFGQEGGLLYYAMEYVDGPSLQYYLKKNYFFSWEEVIHIGIEICKALKHAHDRGIIHRDIKPANILLLRNGQVKVSDYGIAHFFGDSRLTTANMVIGTIEYMAPEQAMAGPLTPKSDIYSLGALLYTLLMNTPPYSARSLPEIHNKYKSGPPESIRYKRPEVPSVFDLLIMELLRIQPEQRPQNVQIVGKRLEAIRFTFCKHPIRNPFESWSMRSDTVQPLFGSGDKNNPNPADADNNENQYRSLDESSVNLVCDESSSEASSAPKTELADTIIYEDGSNSVLKDSDLNFQVNKGHKFNNPIDEIHLDTDSVSSQDNLHKATQYIDQYIDRLSSQTVEPRNDDVTFDISGENQNQIQEGDGEEDHDSFVINNVKNQSVFNDAPTVGTDALDSYRQLEVTTVNENGYEISVPNLDSVYDFTANKDALDIEGGIDMDSSGPIIGESVNSASWGGTLRPNAKNSCSEKEKQNLENSPSFVRKETNNHTGDKQTLVPESHFIVVREDELDRLNTNNRKSYPFVSPTVWCGLIFLICLGVFLWSSLRKPEATPLFDKIERKINTSDKNDHLAALRSAEKEIQNFLSFYPNDTRAITVRRYANELELGNLERRLERQIEQGAKNRNLTAVERIYIEAAKLTNDDPELGVKKLDAFIKLFDSDEALPKGNSSKTKTKDADGTSKVKNERREMFDRTTQGQCVILAKRRMEITQGFIEQKKKEQQALIEGRLEFADSIEIANPKRADEIRSALIIFYGDKEWTAPLIEKAKEALAKQKK